MAMPIISPKPAPTEITKTKPPKLEPPKTAQPKPGKLELPRMEFTDNPKPSKPKAPAKEKPPKAKTPPEKTKKPKPAKEKQENSGFLPKQQKNDAPFSGFELRNTAKKQGFTLPHYAVHTTNYAEYMSMENYRKNRRSETARLDKGRLESIWTKQSLKKSPMN